MAEFLFEIFSEEIPACMQEKAGADLSRMITAALEKAGLFVKDAAVYSGPRRLVFTADIPKKSPDVKEERKGPRTLAPEQARAGFMRGAGITDISQAEIRSDKKGDYYVAMLEKKGRDSGAILAEVLPEIMRKFPWPKSMKSGTSSFRWVRPIKSIVCLLDGDVVSFSAGGITASNLTHGHRRMGAGPFRVKSFKDYRDALEGKGHVIIDAGERKDIILKHAKAACAKASLELVEDEGLLSEVAGLAEWPTVILGDMDESFLKLPGEVIRLSMRTHQKYFAVKNPKTGQLAPKFIVVANQVAPDGGKEIALGNSRVLSARLDDARFFQGEDIRDGKKLFDNYEKLDGVIFHQKLGTVKDKSERVAALARELAPKVGANPDAAEQAARLAKCDLVTNMVVEFTSLQGQIGRLMYERENGLRPAASDHFSAKDHADIAIAIEEHYKPQGPSDKVPTNPVAIAVALADKIDVLFAFFDVVEKPTGSKDPFALRRAALGVVRLILDNNIPGNLSSMVLIARNIFYEFMTVLTLREKLKAIRNNDGSIKSEDIAKELDLNAQYLALQREYKAVLKDGKKLNQAGELVCAEGQLRSFILGRLKIHLRDQGVHHTHIDAVFALGGDDLVDISSRVHALGDFLSTEGGANLLAGYKRASNILKAEQKKGALPEVGVSPEAGVFPGAGVFNGRAPEETTLFTALEAAKPLVMDALGRGDYAEAMKALASLRAPIDAFFDKVIVNSNKASERANRLGLLIEIRTLAGAIADFDKVEG